MTSYMNNRTMVPAHEQGILDFAPGAAAAYSLRNLSYTYVGPVVTVRRSTDSAEADFTANEVSDGTLAAWCSGGDGFVKTWHDQSQHGRDATQATTSYQPQIVVSGVVISAGGKPTLLFDGIGDRLQLVDIASMPQQTVCSAFCVAGPLQFAGLAPGSANARFFDIRATSSSFQLLRDSGTSTLVMKNLAWQPASLSTDFQTATTGLKSYAAMFLSASNLLFVDAASQGSTAGGAASAAGTVGNIGARADVAASTFFDGHYSELIFFFSDMTALRDLITGNQMWYY